VTAAVRVRLIEADHDRAMLKPHYVVVDNDYDVCIHGNGATLRVGNTVLASANLDAEKLDLAMRIEQSDMRLRDVLDSSGDLIHMAASDGRLLYVNRTWRNTLGYSEEQIATLRVAEIVVPEHRDAFCRALDRALMGERVEIDSVLAKHDGRRLVVTGYLTGHVQDGATITTYGAFRDVTEQRRAEDAQRRLVVTLENTVDLVAIYTMAGQVVYLNHAARRVLGDVVDRLYAPDALVVALREGHWSGEATLHGADGTEIPVAQVLVAHPSAQGGVWFLSTIMRDLSEWKKLDRMKNEFVSTVSHELRTPLTSIRGALGLLEAGVTGELSDKGIDLVHVARENCERLIRLINDMLDLDKIEAGVLPLELKDLVPTEIVQTTLDGIAGMAVVYGIKLEHSVVPTPTVRADHDRIVQVLTNLVSNAIKFSPTGSVVRVAVTATNDRMRFAVENPGQGIPPADREKLFRRFQQLDGADNRQRGGTGLGLAIAKAIVEQHHGRIGFDSEPGVRTTFWFDLPLDLPVRPIPAR
jgi:PAS domain S-box-containing protein